MEFRILPAVQAVQLDVVPEHSEHSATQATHSPLILVNPEEQVETQAPF